MRNLKFGGLILLVFLQSYTFAAKAELSKCLGRALAGQDQGFNQKAYQVWQAYFESEGTFKLVSRDTFQVVHTSAGKAYEFSTSTAMSNGAGISVFGQRRITWPVKHFNGPPYQIEADGKIYSFLSGKDGKISFVKPGNRFGHIEDTKTLFNTPPILAKHPNGKVYGAVVSHDRKKVSIFDLDSGKAITEVHADFGNEMPRMVLSNDQLMFSAGESSPVRFQIDLSSGNINSGKIISTLEPFGKDQIKLVFAGEDNRLNYVIFNKKDATRAIFVGSDRKVINVDGYPLEDSGVEMSKPYPDLYQPQTLDKDETLKINREWYAKFQSSSGLIDLINRDGQVYRVVHRDGKPHMVRISN